ncbi:MAG: hypothetical protein WC725_04450 [Patescibacteria group bacterium]|jgi:hypothetical protein
MHRSLLFVVLFITAVAVGCGRQGSPDVAQDLGGASAFKAVQNLNPGLTIYKASGGELRGSYRANNSAIHFQALRGENLVLGVNTVDPDAPAYAVSVRIIDQEGNPVAIAIGDSDERISAWQEKVEGLGTGSNPDLSETFVLAQEATDVLSQTVTSGFDEEIKTLKRRSFTAAPVANAPGQSSKMQALSSTWRYWLRMFRKDANFNGNFADHSAVIVNVTKPDGTILNYVTCNHGTCADDPSMQFRCQNTVYPASQRPFAILPCDSVSSYGFFSGQHVCNDDTLVQVNMVVYGNSSLTTCTDSSLRLWAPSCS